MDKVGENLFVGTSQDAKDQSLLREHGISTTISLTHEGLEDSIPSEQTVVNVPMVDGPQNDREAFSQAVNEVVSYLDDGQTVLIHCSAGASRSPSVAATALALARDRSLSTAFQEVVDRRTAASPHTALINQAASVYLENGELYR